MELSGPPVRKQFREGYPPGADDFRRLQSQLLKRDIPVEQPDVIKILLRFAPLLPDALTILGV